MSKALGADIFDYYKAWPLGEVWYLDSDESCQEIEDEKGTCALDIQEKYDLDTFGDVLYQGPSPRPEVYPTFAKEVTKWIKARTTVTFVVEVPREQEVEAKLLLKNHIKGAKIR